MANPKTEWLYRSKKWRTLASYIRQKNHYICQQCKAPNAKEVHHIQEVTVHNMYDANITLNESNLMLLCRQCHNAIHNRFVSAPCTVQGRHIQFDSEGNVINITDTTDNNKLLL